MTSKNSARRMRLLSTFKIAARALRRNKMRSALTALGIIIGVGALIAMISIGHGAKAMVEAQVASLGQNRDGVAPQSFGRLNVAQRLFPVSLLGIHLRHQGVNRWIGRRQLECGIEIIDRKLSLAQTGVSHAAIEVGIHIVRLQIYRSGLSTEDKLSRVEHLQSTGSHAQPQTAGLPLLDF